MSQEALQRGILRSPANNLDDRFEHVSGATDQTEDDPVLGFPFGSTPEGRATVSAVKGHG